MASLPRKAMAFRFHPAHLNQSDAKVLRESIRIRVLRLFKRRGLLDPGIIDNLKAWSHGGGFSVYADADVRLQLTTKRGAKDC